MIINKTSSSCGAIITGINLEKGFSNNQMTTLLNAIYEHKCLVIKNQNFSHKGYNLLVMGFFVCGFQITLVATHIPGYMQERGMGGWSATIILALIGLFNISSRVMIFFTFVLTF